MKQFLDKLFYNKLLTSFLLLSPLLIWLGVVYLGSLFTLLLQSFFSLDSFSGKIIYEFSFENYTQLTRESNIDIFIRTILMSSIVTIVSVIIAFPIAYYMSFLAKSNWKPILYLGIMFPLWSSYMVKVYAWKLILAKEGILNWCLERIGLQAVLELILELPYIGGSSLSFSYIGIFLVFLYIWLPFMILPIYSALERIPKNLVDASMDLGATPLYTLFKVILPLSIPGVVAGSIFTFSLTMGDYIIPTIIGNSSYFIGMAVYTLQGTTGNIPLAASFSVVPIVVMGIYLRIAKKLGAFDAI
ncbi:MAG: ABC transporter permease [Leptospiraceae bacterium]|nr:ABC transporter permease [Leptospiraceae bacterium]